MMATWSPYYINKRFIRNGRKVCQWVLITWDEAIVEDETDEGAVKRVKRPGTKSRLV